jgi:hypothetical protein
MTYIVGINREADLKPVQALRIADGLLAMAERHSSYASALGLYPEQRRAIEDNVSIARIKARKLAFQARNPRSGA